MNWTDILAKLRELNIPPEEYIVVGGGALAARNIRDTEDIDLVVSPVIFEKLVAEGWRLKLRPNGKPGLHYGCIEAYLDVHCGNFEPSLSSLLEQAETIEEIRILDLKNLAKFKRQYGREKDLADLQLIRMHIESQDNGWTGLSNQS